MKAADMPEKDPTSYSLFTYAYIFALSAWGGVVSWLRKRKAGDARPYNFTELIGEIVTSAFVGVVTFYLCESAGISPLMTAACVAVTGHMGTRALFHFENVITKKLGGEKWPQSR